MRAYAPVKEIHGRKQMGENNGVDVEIGRDTAQDIVPVAKTGPAVWAALTGEARTSFEDEFRAALAKTGEDFDLDRLTKVVHAWWPAAWGTANPDREVDEAIERYRDGDESEVSPAPVYDGGERP
ncbi:MULTISPECIES: DUF6247 family protein [unclassified Crossiella]|uniref:DUF6247 family protein n=1 Tax=unclassified Crossiella TaxID=2620835 RepID=UPI00200047AF|nr:MULTISPECIES: DUF6247 family protein [unclassified Crossiella]MCK2242133.1 DUF6247 family protein [Crossiella sp. S99.2]MCK2256036.1 DUF6247 family protein [Crossiella sp. S99.1]